VQSRYWELIAHVYDWQLPLERPALNVALDLLDPTESERLLDVATGTGAVLRELARRTRRPAEAVGVDLSSRMLTRAEPVRAGWQLVQAMSPPFRSQTQLSTWRLPPTFSTSSTTRHWRERSPRYGVSSSPGEDS